MKNLNYLLLIVIISAMFITGCKKNVEPVQPELEKGSLYMHLHTFVGGNEVESYDSIYATHGGRKISLSLSQLYLSNIELEKLDGSLVSMPDTIILQTLDVSSYAIGEAPVGNYKAIRFNVGLAPSMNANLPTFSSRLNNPEMWFSSTAQPGGYVFINVQGKIDTTSNAKGSDAEMQPFVYKIGTNENLKQVILPNHNFSISANKAEYIHLMYDLSKLFTGISINDVANLSIDTPATNANAVAAKVRDNIPSMFSYEGH